MGMWWRNRLAVDSAWPPTLSGLCNEIVYDVAENVGEAEIAARVAVGEFLVVEAHQVQNRCVQVVYVYGLFNSFEAEFVGCAVHVAATNAAAREPHGKAVVVVVAAVDLAGVRPGFR